MTACTGHTGPELRMGQTFTREQCEAMLYQDLAQHTDALSCIRQPLTDGQRAAFLSFAFNVGEGAFCGSTLVRKANAGDMDGACAELSRWTYAGGKQLPGLVRRRAAERQLCEGGGHDGARRNHRGRPGAGRGLCCGLGYQRLAAGPGAC